MKKINMLPINECARIRSAVDFSNYFLETTGVFTKMDVYETDVFDEVAEIDNFITDFNMVVSRLINKYGNPIHISYDRKYRHFETLEDTRISQVIYSGDEIRSVILNDGEKLSFLRFGLSNMDDDDYDDTMYYIFYGDDINNPRSYYFRDNNLIIRYSDHWGKVGSCMWGLKNGDKLVVNPSRYDYTCFCAGVIRIEDLKKIPVVYVYYNDKEAPNKFGITINARNMNGNGRETNNESAIRIVSSMFEPGRQIEHDNNVLLILDILQRESEFKLLRDLHNNYNCLVKYVI